MLMSLFKIRNLIKNGNIHSHNHQRYLSHIIQCRMNNNPLFRTHKLQIYRNFAIMRVINSVLKIRYLVIGSTVTSTVTYLKVCST